MPADNNRCPKCGFSRGSADKATITQWMSGCRCDLRPPAAGEAATRMCKTCGKRISEGRAGSLTQWIFGSNICNCENKGFVPPAPISDYGRKALEEDQNEIRQEVEMELDPDTFPTERYKPLSELGQGASGIVYLCRDRLLGKKVAIKCLRSVTSPQLLDFQNEARATSQLKHPGVVTVMDFGGTASGAPFMVMEFVRGITLDRFIQENGQMSPEMCVSIFADIGLALAYTHDKGIFHRDLKSSNIILFDSGEVFPGARLIDFGVAGVKNANQEPTIVQGVTLVGTPLYMAPDQAFGMPYSARSEIYSLGCVLFEALTGQPPFHGDSALETIGMHAHDPAPTLANARPDLSFSEELEAIVACCLEKHPDDRYQSMEELSLALMDASAPSPSREEQAPATPGKGKGKLKLIPVLIGLTIVVLACTMGVSTLMKLDSSGELTSTEYSDKASILIQNHKFDEAIEYANKALKKDKDNLSALEVRALANLAKHQPLKALPDINLAIDKYDHIDPLTTKSLAFLRSGGHSLIFHRLMILKALGRSPDQTPSYLYEPPDWEKKYFGDLMPRERSMSFANIPSERSSMSFDNAPTTVTRPLWSIRSLLAWKQIESGNHVRALQIAKEAVREYPNNLPNHDTLGVAYYLNGNTKSALAELNTVISGPNDPAKGSAYFHKGVVLVYTKASTEDVIRNFEAAIGCRYAPTAWEEKTFKKAIVIWNQVRNNFELAD